MFTMLTMLMTRVMLIVPVSHCKYTFKVDQIAKLTNTCTHVDLSRDVSWTNVVFSRKLKVMTFGFLLLLRFPRKLTPANTVSTPLVKTGGEVSARRSISSSEATGWNTSQSNWLSRFLVLSEAALARSRSVHKLLGFVGSSSLPTSVSCFRLVSVNGTTGEARSVAVPLRSAAMSGLSRGYLSRKKLEQLLICCVQLNMSSTDANVRLALSMILRVSGVSGEYRILGEYEVLPAVASSDLKTVQQKHSIL